MKRTVAALLLFVGAAFPYVAGYDVEPVKALWSGWAPSQYPNNYVAQTVACNFDSLSYVELFAGSKGSGGTYTATVYDNGVLLMSNNANFGDTLLNSISIRTC
jgi:hypothetical protein